VAGERTITSDIPDKILLVSMDAKLILQVLINLIDNAIKHTETDGIIRMQVNQENSRIWFVVSDNGTGIRQSDFPYLFDPFFVSQSAGSTSRSGVGLGLSIVKAIVQAHGGSIFAENGEDGGAVFRFYLPVRECATDE
jgi:K+-sensing histidine kinase KdpD